MRPSPMAVWHGRKPVYPASWLPVSDPEVVHPKTTLSGNNTRKEPF